MFWHNEEYSMGLGKDIYLDGVVCLVDAVYGQRVRALSVSLSRRNLRCSTLCSKLKKTTLARERERASGMTFGVRSVDFEPIGVCSRQVACSDVILINKVDLVSEAQTSALEGVVHGINPLATTHRTTQSNIDLGLVMNLNAYAARVPPTSIPKDRHDHVEGKCTDPESHPKSTHYTIRGISSILVPVPVLPAAQVEVLDEWIRSVLWEHKLQNEEGAGDLDVLRCKGMFRTDAGEVYVLQGVREMYDLSPTETTEESDGVGEIGKLVFIGKGLDDRVRTSLEATVLV
jgi:G3E family GTPase